MKILLGMCCLALAFGFSATSKAAEADQYEFKAALAFEKAIDIALAGDRILVLSPGTVSILDGATPGPMLNRVGSISIGKEYSKLAADGEIVAVATSDGRVSIYELNGDELAHRAEYSSGDSIIAMKVVGDELCLAKGYDGVRIVDVSDPLQPRVTQNLPEPDYSQEVDLAGEFLYVLDALNGVTVYAQSDGEYRHLDDILSDIAPTDISAHQYGVAISYGTRQCEVWDCSVAHGATLDWIVETEYPASLISGIRTIDTMFYLASEMGELAVVGRVTSETGLPFPAEKMIAFEHSTLYSVLVLDRAGNVTAFNRDPILEGEVRYNGAAQPSAMAAVGDGLVVSLPSGIQMLTILGDDVELRTILPGAPITDVLAESDRYLVTGSARDGVVRTYIRERGRWRAGGELETSLTIRRLFIREGSSEVAELVAVGDEGLRCYTIESDASWAASCSLLVEKRICCADFSSDWLVTATEDGDVSLYAFMQGNIILVGETRCAKRPRDVIVTPEGVVVVAHNGGLDIFKYVSSSGELAALASPAAISSAFDLSYDAERREVLVASGSTPVKYLDFSDPTQLGTVFLIAGTEGTSEIAIRDERLYCLSADWIRVYERRENLADRQRMVCDIQSVTASPNPFNSNTQIAIELAPSALMPLPFEVSLINLLGQTLSRQEFVAGDQSIVIDLPQVIGRGNELPSGVYFFVVRTANEVVTRKLLLLK